MKTLVVLAMAIPAMAIAKSPFDGIWKTRLSSMQFSGKPDVVELNNGMYDCRSCVPPFKIKADGTDQPVPDHDYLDHMAVTVTSPTTVEYVNKKAGKVEWKSTESVSADGSKLTGKFTNFVGDKPTTGEYTERRVAKGAPGAHMISGSWQQDAMPDISELARTVTYQSTPNGLKGLWNGLTTDAKFDGKEYPTVGDPGNTMVTLKKISDTQIEETDRRRGKVADVISYVVAADGKSMQVVDTDPQHGTKTTYILDKQP
jgi:hypothetical protein